VSPSRLPTNISSEPIPKPHMVGNAIIEAIKTSVEPMCTRAKLELFIAMAPYTPKPTITNA